MYLIRRALPKEFASSYRWSLVAIKIDDRDNPYIAFESSLAADDFIATVPELPVLSAVESSCLGLDTYLSPNASAILFSSVGKLNEWRGDGMQQQLARVSIPSGGAFEKIVRKFKDWYAAWRSRKLVHEG